MAATVLYKGHEILEMPYKHPDSRATVSFVIRVATGVFKGTDIGYKMTLWHARKFIDGLKEVLT
jgi:hypothetical protein